MSIEGKRAAPAPDQEPANAPDQASRDSRRWWILLVVSAAQFMVGLDATVVNVMMPELQDSLGLSATGLQWVLSIYVLLFGGLMLLGGRLTDVIGRRRVLLAGLVLFTAGSLAAGLAEGEAALLAARAVQGVAAAALSPAALSILVMTFVEPAERAKAFGIWGTVLGVGASIGTLLGGAIVEVGWRWAFYINIPIGVVLVVVAIALIPGGAPVGSRPASDIGGALTSTAGLLLLVFGIVSTTTRGWTDGLTLGAFGGAVVLLAIFPQVERRSAAPLVPLRLFRQRAVVAGSLGQLTTAGIMLPAFFLLPMYMQNVLGYSPLETGLAYIPTSLAMMIIAPVVAGMIAKTGPMVLYVTGTLFLGGMVTLMLYSSTDGSYWSLLLPVTALLGIGLVLCMIPTPVVGTSQATPEDAGTTSALLNAATEIGGAFGLAVIATAVESRFATLVARGVDPVDAFNQALHVGFGVMFVWVGLSLVTGLVGFRGLGVAASDQSAQAATGLAGDPTSPGQPGIAV